MPKQTSIPIEDKEEIDKISKLVPKIFGIFKFKI